MKLSATLALVLPAVVSAVSGPKGIDVSSHQTSVNWSQVKSNGVQFAYIKATEGTGVCPS
jgi:GH25 family lysozyme M1 (1,4-beta-N-acetylmuramidase)